MLQGVNQKENTSTENIGTRIVPILKDWEFRALGDGNWYPAVVPGTNYTDLLYNNLIEEPFYRANERDLQWIELRNWEYRTGFFIENFSKGQKGLLIFEGLDTYADIYLNGTLILEASNMFITWKQDVSEVLVNGKNTLHILFRSPTREVAEKADNAGILYPAENDHSQENLSVFIRKAPYHFGWDWAPRFVTSGIWRPVSLKLYDQSFIEDIKVRQSLEANKANLDFEIEITSAVDITLILQIICISDDLAPIRTVHPVKDGQNFIHQKLVIKDYKKWWPKGFGEAYLYEFKFDLIVDDQVISTARRKTGLRVIETINKKDAYGQSFFFKVNGVPIYAKGANYIPQDSFPNRVTDQQYQDLFQNVIAANMNMLRVWGGGIYESDLFYDLADQHGILIWQDFMFACTMYPGDREFLESIQQEAICNIKRLRNHPCLAMWCGNNEVKMGWESWGWQEKFNYSLSDIDKLKSDYHKLFEELLPNLVQQFDPDRHYLPSSPMNNWDDPELLKYGDHHYWGVWHGQAPFDDFKKNVPRFMSEFGFQSFPIQTSVEQYTLPEDCSIDSEVMKIHQKHPKGNELIATYSNRSYRKPKDFEFFLYLSQVVQAEGIRIAIEAQRRNMPFCMGTLYWQLNDCWPVASWSSIDYYGKWKALHFEVARQFSQSLISCDISLDGTINTYIVSDILDPKPATMEITIKDFEGNALLSEKKDITVKPGSGKLHHVLKPEAYLGINTEQVFILARLDIVGKTYSNIYYFHPVKELDLPVTDVQYEIIEKPKHWQVTLYSSVLVKSIYLDFEGLSGNFSDNFFDLLPKEKKQVSFPRKSGNHRRSPRLKLISVRDTY